MVTMEVVEMEKERTRKRPRLAWDVAPSGLEVGFSIKIRDRAYRARQADSQGRKKGEFYKVMKQKLTFSGWVWFVGATGYGAGA